MTENKTKIIMALVSSAIIIFSSCKQSKKHLSTAQIDEPFIQQAKNSDIPTPIGFSLSESNNDELSKTIFVYKGRLSIKKSTRFYRHAMELNGWEIKNFSTPREGLLVCTKANKECAVNIGKNPKTSNKSRTIVRIVIHKEEAYVTNARHCLDARRCLDTPTPLVVASQDDSDDIINQKDINI